MALKEYLQNQKTSEKSKCTFESGQWTLEDFDNPDKNNKINLHFPEADLERRHTIQVRNCHYANIHIPLKVNTIDVENCNHTTFIIHSLIGSISFFKCNRLELRIKQAVPSILIDNCNKVDIFVLHPDGKNINFTTSCSTEMNLSFPEQNVLPENPMDLDMIEIPIPQQFQHELTNNVLKSKVSDLY